MFIFTPLWCRKRFYESLKGLHRNFWCTAKNFENQNFKLFFSLCSGSGWEGLIHHYDHVLQGELRIAVLPSHLNYDSPWPVRKVPLRMTPYDIVYDHESKVSISLVAKSVSGQFQFIYSFNINQGTRVMSLTTFWCLYS